MNAAEVKAGQVGVRMYKVGFGDCFLIFIPGKTRTHKMLVDCGSMGKAALSMSEIVEHVVEDVKEGGNPVIDVVVATHRHRDHVSGFADKAWKDVRVREVWMPWTEDPKDPAAKKLRNGLTAFARKLHMSVASNAKPALAKRIKAAADTTIEPDDLIALADRGRRSARAGVDALAARNAFIALNALSNPEAMETLHRGFDGSASRWFLPEKNERAKRARSFRTAALPNVKVSVLGPSHDAKTIRQLDPPKGESYFRMNGPSDGARGKPPFGNEWRHYPQRNRRAYPPLSAHDRKLLREAAEGDVDALAASADSKLNGTSLVLVLEIGSVNLLLAGDAQWGTWKTAIEDAEWGELLERTKFIKVGHHGSHNATPKSLLEDLLGKRGHILAMVSTRQFGNWDIPREPLMKRLAAKGKVARTDKKSATPFKDRGHCVDIVIDTK